MGGGRKNFLRVGDHDDDNNTIFGLRKDGRNLKEEWLKTKDHLYVNDKHGFDNLTPDVKKKVLGELYYYNRMVNNRIKLFNLSSFVCSLSLMFIGFDLKNQQKLHSVLQTIVIVIVIVIVKMKVIESAMYVRVCVMNFYPG